MDFDWNSLFNLIISWCLSTGLKIVVGFIVLVILFKITNLIFNQINKSLSKKDLDKTIKSVLISVFRKVVKILLVVIYVGFLGIETSSITALIASCAVAVGLALQGALSNFAGGVMIVVLRTIKIGDFVETNGQSGTVKKIELFNTHLVTGDGKLVIIPNGKIIGDVVINYSASKTRRLDIVFSIAYENDFRKAKQIIKEEIEKSGLALSDPEPFINVKSHSASSVDIIARVWVKTDDYWDLNWFMMESVKMAFDKNNISIPYQQVDVHMKNDVQEDIYNDNDKYVQKAIAEYQNKKNIKMTKKEQEKMQELKEEKETKKSLLKKFEKASKVVE